MKRRSSCGRNARCFRCFLQRFQSDVVDSVIRSETIETNHQIFGLRDSLRNGDLSPFFIRRTSIGRDRKLRKISPFILTHADRQVIHIVSLRKTTASERQHQIVRRHRRIQARNRKIGAGRLEQQVISAGSAVVIGRSGRRNESARSRIRSFQVRPFRIPADILLDRNGNAAIVSV